ncbi:DNRLRE domain-containing protein [Pyxidicoccus fallax]|uniref:DNRLRE domain-containing protein n=1 Tax=Pyxidicoccus fallax TaxID=394095 RepID=A0A848L5M4_9BACT|nr:DNRLRE domain-containing protein [Pyxidicoccus fallax]NMO14250.1 DNRLRE domain-containing protein [Pyxidicoccus fallax]NPC80025.1 DNRLRE domain-containing protein [Pyxidicoccus fallax]
MHRSPPWKQSLRSLLIAPLVAALVPGCGPGEAPPEPTPPAPPAQAARLTSAPTPTQLILEPEADTFVRDSSPNGNFGTNQNLNVDSRYAETYLRFNLSSIPAGSHIASVRLEALAHYGSAYGGDGSVYAHLVPNDTWSETGMTWNNRPAATGDRLGSWWLWYGSTSPLQMGVNASPRLRAPVQQALDSDQRISFRLSSPGYMTVYRSREYPVASERPKLVITYFAPGELPVNTDLQVVALYPMADAQVLSSSPTGNSGKAGSMTVDRTAAETFLRFGLGSVPSNAQVVAVSLVATSSAGDVTPGADGNVYTRLVSDNTWSESAITWNNKPTASSDDLGSWQLWNRAGQYTTQVGINSSPTLVEPVQEALGSDGMISFRLDSPGSRSVYDSREYSNTSARWPQLLVSYFVPPPCPTPTASTPAQVVLEPEADTNVQAATPNANYGTDQNLHVDSSKAETYLRFNLSSIPAGARIASVRLEALAYGGSSAGGDGSVYAHLVPDDTWSETGMTWNTRPPVNGSDLGSWWLWNPNTTPKPLQLGVNFDPKLKAPVQQALDSDGLISFRLMSPGYHTMYRSREYGVASERPRLVISYFEPGDPQVTSELQAASFFPVADASVLMSSPDANSGASMSLTVDRDGAETFLRFNLAALPPTAQVASVVLVTTSSGGDVTPGADHNVYTRWVPNNTWSETGLTWNTRPSTFSCELGSWQRNTSYTTQAGINASPKLVDPVRQALASDGLISFRLDSPGSRSVYDSREYSNTSAHWPRLIVYYSIPTATP